MKFKRIISILVLVCFFITQVVIKPKEAEAAIPAVAGIIVDAVASMAISAGVTYAIQGLDKHVAANEVGKLSDAEIRRIRQEGGLTEVTVDEFLEKGYKVKRNPKRIYKIKGPFKAGLIGGVLSLGISGGQYLIDYISEVRSEFVPHVLNESVEYYPKRYTLQSGESKEFTIEDPCSKENGGMPKTYSFGVPQGHELNVKVRVYNYGWQAIYGSIKSDDTDRAIKVEIYYNEELEDPVIIIIKKPSGESEILRLHTTPVDEEYLLASHSINVTVTNNTDIPGYYEVIGPGFGEMYRYEGSVATEDIVINDSPIYQKNRQRLEEVKNREDKVVYIIQYPDGEVGIETGTEIGDKGGELPDLPPGEDTPIEPPDEEGKPDLKKLYGVITTRWPFSLPWDIAYLLNIVFADPVPPKWTFTLPENFGSHEFTIDMTQLEGIMPVVRWFITFAFCFGIVLAIRKLYGGSV